MQAIVCDLGGTHLRCGVAGPSGAPEHVAKVHIENFLSGHGPSEIARRLVARITAYAESVAGPVARDAPIVLSFPGPIGKGGRTLDAPTLFGEAGPPPDLVLELRRQTRREVHTLNDLSAAAWRLAEVHTAVRFLVVATSSGIGSKIFDRRHADGVLDHPPYSGEIGHAVVDWGETAPRCDCGGRGHLGAVASGRGIERSARRRARHGPGAFARSLVSTWFGANAATLTNEVHLVPAALAGDRWALSVIEDGTRYLARALGTVVLAAGVERVIVIGGFAAGLGPVYETMLRDLLRESCDYRLASPALADLVHVADAEEETCLEGAAVYARHLSQTPRNAVS